MCVLCVPLFAVPEKSVKLWASQFSVVEKKTIKYVSVS